MKRSHLLLSTCAVVAAGLFQPYASAQTVETVAPVSVVDAAPERAAAIEHIDILVEGEALSVRARNVGLDTMEIEADPIFEALRSKFEARESILGYWRFQDGAVIGLDFSDGKVRANGAVLGKLPNFPVRDVADTWLSVNAISVLTGTVASQDEAEIWTFNLDERLKPQFDLDLWVNDTPVTAAMGEEPRTIGPVLLVPLRPIIKALGHTLVEDEAAGTVTVTRVHDSAVISMELATGLVTINGIPSGVTPDVNYVEPGTLVMPFSAVETLTGSHVKLVPGTSRVDVTLDDRLSSLALPGEKVVDDAANTGFTPEKLDYQISDNGPVTLGLTSRFGGYNTETTIETAGGIDNPAGYVPRWMSVDVQALDGWRATVGDYNGGFRELTGTGVSRIRGVAYRQKKGDDTIMAIAAGVPVMGSRQIAENVSAPTFSGAAAGVRFIATDGQQEWGVSAVVSDDANSGRIVLGGRKQLKIDAPGEKGLESAYVSGEIGGFTNDGNAVLDLRGRAEARYKYSDQTSVHAVGSYEGGQFRASSLGGLEAAPGPKEASGGVTTGSVSIDWHSAKERELLRNLAAGLRSSVSYTDGDQTSLTSSFNGAVSAKLGAAGPHVSVSTGMARFTQSNVEETQTSASVRAIQPFEWGNVSGSYSQSDSAGQSQKRGIITASLPGWRKSFDKGVNASVNPTANVVWTPQGTETNFGASATATSGHAFGDRFRLNGQFSTLAAVRPDAQATSMFGSMNAVWRLSKAANLNATYSTDFQGRNDVSISLRGSILFNEGRKHTRPKDGAGILKGNVFFDRNRDGIQQDDEPGIPGVKLSVGGTRMALNVNSQGGYTIQNIPIGLYSLKIDRRSLPLGLLISEENDPRATVGDGRVTTLNIPVIASGQVRGAVYVDGNENGELDAGEQRLEGQWVKLIPEADDEEPHSIQSVGFGQYSFESVMPGAYTLRVNIGGHKTNVPVELTDEELFHEVDIAVPLSAMARAMPADSGLVGTP